MKSSIRKAFAVLLLAAPCFSAPLFAMGPNPGGKLGEDMPFQGEDVVRRAPAATAERDSRTPSGQNDCPPVADQDGQVAHDADRAACPPAPREAAPSTRDAGPAN